jgi:hypothetical protein
LSLQARPQAEASNAAAARGEVFVGVSPEIKNRNVYNDFIVAQIKVTKRHRFFVIGCYVMIQALTIFLLDDVFLGVHLKELYNTAATLSNTNSGLRTSTTARMSPRIISNQKGRYQRLGLGLIDGLTNVLLLVL